MRKFILPFVLAFATITGTALAETLTSESAKVKFDEPKGWHHRGDGDVITIMDKEEDVAIAFMSVPDGAVVKATEALEKQLSKTVSSLKWEKEEKVKVNGMEGVSVSGDGQIDGKSVDILVLVLNTPSPDHDLIVLAMGEDARLAKHKAEVKGVFKSLKPVKLGLVSRSDGRRATRGPRDRPFVVL
jgi:hypothetical protein